MILINNAKIFTMDNRKEYSDGFILLNSESLRGEIVALGNGDGVGTLKELSKNSGNDINSSLVIDAKGGCVMPGIIDPHCHLGLWADSQRPETGDGNEMTDPCTPQLRAIDAINPFDFCFKEAVEAGITSVMTGPGSANVIAGQFSFIKTFGTNIDQMTVKSNAAMKAALGENPKGIYGPRNNTPGTRMGNAAVFREALIKAAKYKTAKDKHEKDTSIVEPEFNIKHESLIPVLEGTLMLKIHAHRADDLLTAVRICNEFNLIYTLDHCTEGYMIADDLLSEFQKGNLKGVITGPLLSDRSKPELSNASIKNPGIMSDKGILTGIMTDHPVIPIQYLAITAAVAVRDGMDEYLALESITINAATLCDVSDRVGSLTIGKDGDVVILTGHPFDIKSKVRFTIIDGKVRYSSNAPSN